LSSQEEADTFWKLEDNLTATLEKEHRIYFKSEADRLKFSDLMKELGYELLPTSGMDEQEPRVYGLQIRRRDRVDQESIDNAVLEILRFAKAVDGEYDGWETELVRPSSLLKSILKKVGLG